VTTRAVTLGFVLFGFVCIAGCATTGAMRAESLDVGVVREFDRDYARVLRAARSAVMSAGLVIDSDERLNDSTEMIVAKRGLHGWSWGELVRMIVQRAPNDRTTVRVISRRRMATNILAKRDYSIMIFSDMEAGLR
jgi:hypothetical protein